MEQTLNELVIQTLAYNYSKESLLQLRENIYAKLDSVERAAKDLFSSNQILCTSFGHFLESGVRQATEDTFPNSLKPTSGGFHFCCVSGDGCELIVKRSSNIGEWKNANYLHEFARKNEILNELIPDLFYNEELDEPERIFLILDVCTSTNSFNFIVPSFDLKTIHTYVTYDAVLDYQTNHSDLDTQPPQNQKPIVLLKKKLSDTEKKQQNNR